MAEVDLTDLQTATDTEPTIVKLKDETITLRPLMEVGSEHDEALLDLMSGLGKFKDSGKGDEDGEVALDMEQIKEIMPMANQILEMAAPDKKAAGKLLKLPLFSRFKVLMQYVEDQDLGGLFPSEG